MRAPRFFSGFTLLELVIVLGILSILVYVVVRSLRPGEAMALQQAERLRDDLRHMQVLAMTWNQPLRLNVVSGPPASYFVSCASGSATPPCNGAAAVSDPGRAGPFQVELPSELGLTGPGFTLDVDTLGRPKNGAALIATNATYTISGGGPVRTTVVTPLTGFVTAQ
jgi:prepilin-type N-terminal cleavage/methylation domain-containing protein